MQTGKKAGGPTSREFAEQVMKPAMDAAELLAKDPAHKKIFKIYKHCLFSYDNPNVHNGAWEMLRDMGFKAVWKVPLSPYSPDMHRVIEHLTGTRKSSRESSQNAASQTALLQMCGACQSSTSGYQSTRGSGLPDACAELLMVLVTVGVTGKNGRK